MNGYFVAATGTGVGKTYVTCSILRAMKAQGREVSALKPVISGFDAGDADDSDTGLILTAMGRGIDAQNIARVSPWRFRAALSPDMAAAREGLRVGLDEVAGFCASGLRGTNAPVLIEGAGGLMSPLGADFTNLDLAAALRMRVVLVAGSYLGTISHTLTACEALKARGMDAWAIVMSDTRDGVVPLEETAATIGRFVKAPIDCVARGAEVSSALVERIRA